MSSEEPRYKVLRITIHETPPPDAPGAAVAPNRISVEIASERAIDTQAELTVPYHSPSGERRTITARPEFIGREDEEGETLQVYRLTADVIPEE